MSKILLILLILAGAGYLLLRWAGRGEALRVGQPAPAFELADAKGAMRGLPDYAGQWLVLYFYPKDETPGCTTEACNLRDGFDEFRRRNVALIGISVDDMASHAAFAQNHGLPFPLLSDPDGKAAAAYGALWDFGLARFAKRQTYLIDPQGRVAKVFLSVSPGRHSSDLLAEIDRLRLEGRPSATNNQSNSPQ